MKLYTEEEIIKMYDDLPEDLKQAVFGVEMDRIIKGIGDVHKLQIDKIGILGNETGMVMLGASDPQEFAENLSRRLEVDMAEAKKIAQDVSEKVFVKVRESMQKAHAMADIGATGGGVVKQKVAQGNVPPIFLGSKAPEGVSGAPVKQETPVSVPVGNTVLPANPFMAKMGSEIFKAPTEEKKMGEGMKKEEGYKEDPYREPIE